MTLIFIIKFADKEEKSTETEDDEFEDWDDNEDKNDEKYWFTKDKIDRISSTQKIISLDMLDQIRISFNFWNYDFFIKFYSSSRFYYCCINTFACCFTSI